MNIETNRPWRSALGALLALLVLASLPPALAADAVGRVVVARNASAVDAAGVERALARRGAPVFEQDTLITAEGGQLMVRFLDRSADNAGGVVKLGGDSRLEIATYRFDRPADGSDAVLLNALQGAVRAATGAVGSRDPSAFEMTTPVASIGIRGTLFEAAEGTDGRWLFELLEGGISVSNGFGSIDLGPDVDFSIAVAGPVSAPVGLRVAPASGFASTAPAADDDEDDDSGDDDGDDRSSAGAGDDGDDGGDGSAEEAAAAEQAVQRDGPTRPDENSIDLNPGEGLDEPQEVAALEQRLINELFTLSDAERQRLESGEESGLLVGLLPDGSLVSGRATLSDEGEPLLAFELPDGREALLLGQGDVAVRSPIDGVTFSTVSGEGLAGPQLLVDDDGTLSSTEVGGELTFVLVENAPLADLSVDAVYQGSAFVGSGSAGPITELGVFFDAALDLGDGRISDGLLLVEVAAGAEEYRVNFGGQVSGGQASLDVTDGVISGFAIDGSLNVDRDLSDISGAFTPGAEGFGGSFFLQEQGNAERNVQGGFAAEKTTDTGTPPNP